MALRLIIIAGALPSQVTAVKASASEQRRYEGTTNCTGKYTVLNSDVMDQCTPYLVPAPASVFVNQTNDTHYASYHFQGSQDCTGDGRLLSYLEVGSCLSFGSYSQMRVWVEAPKPPVSSCQSFGVCGRAYQGCCIGSELKGEKCTCHLHNGTGQAGSQDCGSCGKAFIKCCSAFQLSGHACACDVIDTSASIVV